MPKKKTQVLCTIPLPMPMDQFVDMAKALSAAFNSAGHRAYIRNGTNCYEIYRYTDDGKPEPEDQDPEPDAPAPPDAAPAFPFDGTTARKADVRPTK